MPHCPEIAERQRLDRGGAPPNLPRREGQTDGAEGRDRRRRPGVPEPLNVTDCGESDAGSASVWAPKKLQR